MSKRVFRQGDVLLVEVAPTKTLAVGNGITLAEGEHSGHHHIIYAEKGDVEIAEVEVNKEFNRFSFTYTPQGHDVGLGDTSPKIIYLPFGGELKHQNVKKEFAWTEEHYDLPIPAGYYKVVHQQQYDYTISRSRNVRD